jgi:FkbM family methyltransferase
LASFGYRISGTRLTPGQLLKAERLRPLELDDVICRRMFEAGESLRFIQVGAFDGVMQDPLRKYVERCRWKGVMVEPQPGPANKLRELYRSNESIKILEAAVDDHPGSRTLYTVGGDCEGDWAAALASFDRASIEKHSNLIPNLLSRIIELRVECVTFSDVLASLGEKGIDLLQIDAEGADAVLLSLFPFHEVLPAIVHWEATHLTLESRNECLDRLAEFGYRFALSGTQDMMAVLI